MAKPLQTLEGMKDPKRSLAPLVLVIEDHFEWSESLQAMLLHEGYRTASARDGLDGLMLAESLAPDLIILTLALPVMDGLEFLQHYLPSKKAGKKRVPVIALSSISAYLYQAIDLGAECALQIPVDRGRLLDLVQSVLSGGELPQASDIQTDDSRGRVSLAQDSVIRPVEPRFLGQLQNLLEMESITLGLVRQGQVRFHEGVGASRETWSREPDLLRKSPCQLVLSSGHWLGIGDLEVNPLFRASEWARLMRLRSYLGAPLISNQGHILGVLAAHAARPRIFLHSEKRLIQLFSQQITLPQARSRLSLEWVLQILPSMLAIAIQRGLRLSAALLEGGDLRMMSQLEERMDRLPWQVLAGFDPMTSSWLLLGWDIEPSVLRGWAIEIASGMSAYSIRVDALSDYGSDPLDILGDLSRQSAFAPRDKGIAG